MELVVGARYVANLKTQITKLDDQYDAMNLVMAQGQAENYGPALLDHICVNVMLVVVINKFRFKAPLD